MNTNPKDESPIKNYPLSAITEETAKEKAEGILQRHVGNSNWIEFGGATGLWSYAIAAMLEFAEAWQPLAPTEEEGGEGTGEQLCLWVSVKNRLPTQNDRYLTIDAHGEVNALWFHGTGNTHWYYDNGCYDEFDPTNSVVTWLEPYTPSQPVEATTPAGDEWEVTAKENIRRARYFYNKSVELQASLTYERERADYWEKMWNIKSERMLEMEAEVEQLKQ